MWSGWFFRTYNIIIRMIGFDNLSVRIRESKMLKLIKSVPLINVNLLPLSLSKVIF